MFGRQVSRDREYWGWFVLAFLLYGLTPLDVVFQRMLGTNNLIDGALILCAIAYGSFRWGIALKKERAAKAAGQRLPHDGADAVAIGECESTVHGYGLQDEVSR